MPSCPQLKTQLTNLKKQSAEFKIHLNTVPKIKGQKLGIKKIREVLVDLKKEWDELR
jgi:riboflavin synthase